MYVCGPTVYDRAHIGNARPVVVFDVLFRLLRHVYGEGHVTYVRNFTDVDDKIIARAAAEKRADPRADRARPPPGTTPTWPPSAPSRRPTSRAPPSTSPEMVAMIETLIARGHAYEAEGHVLFAVASSPTTAASPTARSTT